MPERGAPDAEVLRQALFGWAFNPPSVASPAVERPAGEPDLRVAARATNVAVFTEIIGTVMFGVLLLVLWAVVGSAVLGMVALIGFTLAIPHLNMMPFSGTLRKIDPRSQTPVIALLVFGAIELVGKPWSWPTRWRVVGRRHGSFGIKG